MSAATPLSRRQFLRLLLLLSGGRALGAEAPKSQGDNGIGGTGYQPGDNGIGGTGGTDGTGFIGTIRKFGSVYVNGDRIAYPPGVRIEIDGVSAPASRMRIGQVARLIADRRGETWTTNRITIVSEAIGAIDRIDGRRFEVLGQRIEAPGARSTHSLRAGDRVAVSGLRRPDQTIVASLIEKRESGVDQLAGVVTQDAGGEYKIGGQTITGVSTALVGERVITRGVLANGAFAAHEVKLDTGFGIASVETVSVETWVSQSDGALSTANGIRVEGVGDLRAGSYHVVINGEVGPNGSLIARRMEFPNRQGGFDRPGGMRGSGGPGGGTNGPGGPAGGGANGPGGPRGPGSGSPGPGSGLHGGGPTGGGPDGFPGPAGPTGGEPQGGPVGPGGFGGFRGPMGPGGFGGGGPGGFGGGGPGGPPR